MAEDPVQGPLCRTEGFQKIFFRKKEGCFMCRMDGQPVDEFKSPCGSCPDYLSTCMPVIVDGFVYGECDFSACEFCCCPECPQSCCA